MPESAAPPAEGKAPDPESLASMPTSSEALASGQRKERSDKGKQRAPRRPSFTKAFEEQLRKDVASVLFMANTVAINIPKAQPWALMVEEQQALVDAIVSEFRENPRLLTLASRASGVSAHVKLLSVLAGIGMRRFMMALAQRGKIDDSDPRAASTEPPSEPPIAPVPVGARPAPSGDRRDGERKDGSSELVDAEALAIQP